MEWLYFLVLFGNDGLEYVYDGPMTIEDCSSALVQLHKDEPGQLAYSCEAVRVVETDE